jgi:hypothetical protein
LLNHVEKNWEKQQDQAKNNTTRDKFDPELPDTPGISPGHCDLPVFYVI